MFPSQNKEPWEIYPEIWKTKSAYFTWLRGGLRRMWSTYPAKIAWKKKQLFNPPAGYSGRAKSLGQCRYCSRHFPASYLEVDHVQQAGACNSWEESYKFIHALFQCNGNWVLACPECHKIKSYAEKSGLSLEEARIKKAAIYILGAAKKNTLVEYAIRAGYDYERMTNQASRRQFLEWLAHNDAPLFEELENAAQRSGTG